MSLWPGEADPDTEYDDFIARVDAGEQCAVCKVRHQMRRSTALGLPLFTCRRCGAEHFDHATTPSLT
jgi:hypothetical protein